MKPNLKNTKVEKPKETHHTIVINGKSYAISNEYFVKVQEVDSNRKIYGWSLEFRYKYKEEWGNWQMYWNQKVYQTRDSALTAAIQVEKSIGRDRQYEFRVTALYSMDTMEWRNYTINEILSSYSTPTPPEPRPLKAWKLKEDYVKNLYPYSNPGSGKAQNSITYPKRSLFIDIGLEVIICATPTRSTWRWQQSTLNDLIKKDLVEEVDIMNEKWYHPHLIKEVRQKLNIK